MLIKIAVKSERGSNLRKMSKIRNILSRGILLLFNVEHNPKVQMNTHC
jgi:hypothetical protein